MILHQKVQTSASEEPPSSFCPQWTNPSPLTVDVLWTAPKYNNDNKYYGQLLISFNEIFFRNCLVKPKDITMTIE